MTFYVSELDCLKALRPEAILGIHKYNQKQFYDAHEFLEMAWIIETEPIRDLYRAILQVSVACNHIQKNKYPGAVKLLSRWKKWILPFPENCAGLDLLGFKTNILQLEKELIHLGPQNIHKLNLNLIQPIHIQSKDW